MDKSKYLDIFIEEARENIQSLSESLLAIEKYGYQEDMINEAYRVMHTLKGTAHVIGITPIGELAHVAEDLFDEIKEYKNNLSRKTLDALFETNDSLEAMLQNLVRGEEIDNERSKVLIEKIKSIMANSEIFSSITESDKEHANLIPSDIAQKINDSMESGETVVRLHISLEDSLRFKGGRVFQIARELEKFGSILDASPPIDDVKDEIRSIDIFFIPSEDTDMELLKSTIHSFRGVGELTVSELTEADIIPKEEIAMPKANGGSLSKSDTVRVKSRHLDQLLNLVGEIMISDIRIKQIASEMENRELKQVLKNSERLMGELQDTVLRMRMVPVDYIFNRFPRMVRDMAKVSEKDIDFKIMGNDIEIDRSLLDEIGDSLVHLLRNSVDHGIEKGNVRENIGKPSQGTIILSAYSEQGNIVITIEDDGKGMDSESLLRKSIEKGLVNEKDIDKLTENDALSLAFLPGVSTAKNITDVSGRGVGLDVVKTKIENLGGTVKLNTAPGSGTKVTIRLPPTMAIIKAMLVQINGEKYGIPLENVRETIKINIDKLHEIQDNKMFKLRGEVLPVFDIQEEFGGERTSDDLACLVVEKNDTRAFLIVESLIGQQEIVVKNIGREIRQSSYFSGATILGDGKVALIIDVGAFI